MPAISTIIGALGVAAAIGGTAVSYMGQQKATRAAQDAERLRATQMDLDASRQRREIARRAVAARATALSNATNQGAALGSGLQGGFAQIAGQAGNATVGVNQNQQIGQGLFAANMRQFQGSSQASLGQGISGFGSMLINNQDMFGRVGSYLFNQPQV